MMILEQEKYSIPEYLDWKRQKIVELLKLSVNRLNGQIEWIEFRENPS